MTVSKWRWLAGGPEMLASCFDEEKGICNGVLIKQNGRRRVWRLENSNGIFYAKYEKQPLLSAMFDRKAGKEYKATLLLKELQIPSVFYIAYARRGLTESLLVSREIPDTVSAKEFWFRLAESDSELRKSFLNTIRSLLIQMRQERLRHGDFHAGNILLSQDGTQAYLIDCEQVRRAHSASITELARIVVDFLPTITDAEAEYIISPLTSSPAELLKEVKTRLRKQIAGEWARREKQIRSGNSKFCRKIMSDSGRTFFVSSTFWFSPRELPEELSQLEQSKMSVDRAWQEYLNMFRSRLEGRFFPMDWIVMEHCSDGSAVLYGRKLSDCGN